MTDHLRRVGKVAAFVLFVLGLAAVLLFVLNQLSAGHDERVQQATQIAALQAGLDEANARLAEQGEPPVPVPTAGTDGEVTVVPIPPTQEETADAVAAWFAGHDLSLASGYNEAMRDAVARYLSRNPPADGKPGKDADPPTDQQIADAVTTYLLAHPPADGADGRGVADSSLDGCDVVFTYTDGSTDRIGPICGKDGKDGKDGRGFVEVECLSTGDWIFTLDDGTALTATGPCRAVQPTPTPTATTTRK